MQMPNAKPGSALVAGLCSFVVSQRQALNNFVVLVVLNFAAAGLQFVTMVKIANIWGKAAFGDLAYALAIGTYGAAFVRYGLDRTFVRDLVHFPHRAPDLVAASVVLRSLIFGLVFLSLVGYKAALDPGQSLSWGMIAFIVAVSMTSLNLQGVYDAWGNMQRHAVYNLLRCSVYFAIVWLVILNLPDHLSIGLVGAALILSACISLAIEYYWAVSRIEFKNLNIWHTVATMAKSNVWVWFAAVGSLSFAGLNQLFLKHFSGSAELGSYSACWQIILLAMLLLNQIARIGKPAMARYTVNNPQIRANCLHFLVRYSGIMLAVASIIGIPAVLFPKTIIGFLFRPEYLSAAGTLRVLGIYIMIFAVGTIASQYIVSAHRERAYFASVGVGGVLSVLLCLVLIPRFSTLGAALSLLVAHGVAMGMYVVTLVLDVRDCKNSLSE